MMDGQKQTLKQLTYHLGQRREPSRCHGTAKWFLDEYGDLTTVEDGCGRPSCVCPACRAGYTYQRSKRAWELFQRSGQEILAMWTFSAPPEVFPFMYTEIKKLRKEIWKMVTAFYQSQGIENIGGYAIFHPEGDKALDHEVAVNEGELKYQPHFHVLIALPRAIRYQNIDAMNRLWLQLIQGWFPHIKTVISHYKWYGDVKAIRFGLRYNLRHFPLWTSAATRAQPQGLWAPRAKVPLPPLPVSETPGQPRRYCPLVPHEDTGIVELPALRDTHDKILVNAADLQEIFEHGTSKENRYTVFRRYRIIDTTLRQEAIDRFALISAIIPSMISTPGEEGPPGPSELRQWRFEKGRFS